MCGNTCYLADSSIISAYVCKLVNTSCVPKHTCLKLRLSTESQFGTLFLQKLKGCMGCFNSLFPGADKFSSDRQAAIYHVQSWPRNNYSWCLWEKAWCQKYAFLYTSAACSISKQRWSPNICFLLFSVKQNTKNSLL